ncbi:response regulator [Pseudomonas sp. CCM 7893]|uniref:histidine kinase n=2 Tax=Pseudomonas spelaei TaxID=1055469 RepID=A0A6I3WM76_9PSED|nr:response regulator [Pseudomonas spelaei]
MAALRDYLRLKTIMVPDLSERYYQTLLMGGGIVVSIAILAASGISTMMLVDQFMNERIHAFTDARDLIKSNMNRYQTRLIQTVETYEALWELHDKDQIPLVHYTKLLDDQKGVIVTGKDVTATPITIISDLTQPRDAPELSTLLRLTREISPAPLFPQREIGYYIGGFIYTPDRRFLATWPSLTNEQASSIRLQGGDSFIGKNIDNVEKILNSLDPDFVRKQRLVWAPLYKSPVTDELIFHYIVPVYRNEQRIAVMVITIPLDKFSLVFQDSIDEHGFFVVSFDRKHLFGVNYDNAQESGWANTVLNSVEWVEQHAGHLDIHRSGSMFFISQLIPGPNWIAVYAFDWKSILLALGNKFLVVELITLAVLGVLWTFITLLNRFVLAPLRAHSRQVHESEIFNRVVLTTAPVALAVYDPSLGEIVMQNKAAKILIETFFSRDEFHRLILDPAPREFLEDPPNIDFNTNEVKVLEATLTGKYGRPHQISVVFSRARYQLKEVILFSLTDTSIQKNTIQLLKDAKEAADQANQAKSMFLAMMSHEIRTPLHGALGNLELLALDQLQPRHKERVTTIRRAFDALLVLINDILDLSKIEAHELQINIESFQLDELIEHCAQTFCPVILDKNIRFQCLVDPRLAGTWHGDPHRLSQLLMNLLSNAHKFTEYGSITLRAIPYKPGEGGDGVQISVSDTGIGIPENKLEQIFSPFVQADERIASRFGGTGLGLTLCRKIALLMGGNLTVDSEEGEGSIFTVSLPLVRESKIEPSNPHGLECQFTSVVFMSDSPMWQLVLRAQLRLWLPKIRLIEGELDRPIPPISKQSILLFATFSPSLPQKWQAFREDYLDAVIVSLYGPSYPERHSGNLAVTSLSASMLKLALKSCGQREATYVQTIDHTCLDPIINRKTRVLVAEDDTICRALLKHQLLALGYHQIDSVENGRDALELCENNVYDVIITDLGMPVLGGWALLEALRVKHIYTPVIVCTADTNGAIKNQLLSSTNILYKPITIKNLDSALQKTLGLTFYSTTHSDSTIQIKEIRKLFVNGWVSDEAALRAALNAGDSKLFLGRLHRLKGALLVLGEEVLVAHCNEIIKKIEDKGILDTTISIDKTLSEILQTVEIYSKDAG